MLPYQHTTMTINRSSSSSLLSPSSSLVVLTTTLLLLSLVDYGCCATSSITNSSNQDVTCNTTQVQQNAYYDASIELTPYYQVDCSQFELEQIGQDMSIEMDYFFINDQSLGPISLAQSCVDESSVAQKNSSLSSLNRRMERIIQKSSNNKNNNNQQRGLLQQKFTTNGVAFVYRGSGRCR